MTAPKFIPTEGTYLNVSLPGEILRAMVRQVPSENTAIVEITVEPMARTSHAYRRGDLVACRRDHDGISEIWRAVKVKVPTPQKPVTKAQPRLVVDNADRDVKAPKPPEQKVKRRSQK